MSTVELDGYWPMAEGPGAGASQDRWRRMACLWSRTGVVHSNMTAGGIGEAFHFHGWVEPGMVSIGTGAAWIHAAYGESGLDPVHHHWLATPGDDGMVVLAYDPFVGRLFMSYQAGNHNLGESINPDGYVQIPIWELHGFGTVTDRRTYIPDAPPPPPVTVIPEWVPNRINTEDTNPSQVIFGNGGTPLITYLGWRADYVAGRHWRFTFDLGRDNYNATSTAGWGYSGELWCVVADVSGVRSRFKMGGPSGGNPPQQAGTGWIPAKTVTFTVTSCWAELRAYFEQVVHDNGMGAAWGYGAQALRIEAEELGSGVW